MQKFGRTTRNRSVIWFPFLRPRFLSAIMLCCCGENGVAQDVFAQSMLFPGPNPTLASILPEVSDEIANELGQIVLVAKRPGSADDASLVTEIGGIPSVAEIVRRARPNKAIVSMIEQQLRYMPEFEFEKAALLRDGDEFSWDIQWCIRPGEGGYSGPEHIFQVVASALGDTVEPDMYVYDRFYVKHTSLWLCSVIRMSPSTVQNAAPVISEAEIRAAVSRNVQKLLGQPLGRDLRLADLRRVRIPRMVNKSEEVVFTRLWAVSFVPSGERKLTEGSDVFTVWATEDGLLSDLHALTVNSDWTLRNTTVVSGADAPFDVAR